MVRMSFITLHELCRTFSITPDSFVWASDEGYTYKIPSCVVPQTSRCSMVFKFGEMLGGTCSFPNICGLFSEPLLSDTCNARRAPWIFALLNEIQKQKLIDYVNYYLQKHYH